ncbi:MAG: hypothetical protein ACRDD1_17370, partial [Planctomycetia bacterium]
MKINRPDYSFIRDGLTLEEWMWKLVDGARPERLKAGEAIHAMMHGMPSVHTNWTEHDEFPDGESQFIRFITSENNFIRKMPSACQRCHVYCTSGWSKYEATFPGRPR